MTKHRQYAPGRERGTTIQVVLPSDLHKTLIAYLDDDSVSSWVREAIRNELARRTKKGKQP